MQKKRKIVLKRKQTSLDDKLKNEEIEQITDAISKIVLESPREIKTEVKMPIQEITAEPPPQTSSSSTNYWQSFYVSTNPEQYETYSKTYTSNESSTTLINEEAVQQKIDTERREKKVADTLQIGHSFTYKSSAEKESVATNKLLNFSLNIILYELEKV